MGAGDGLRLMLRTAEIEQAQLMYERVMLAITPLPRTSIRGESWRTVTVRYTPQGASVSLDETPLFTHVPLPHFAPTHRWRIAIGARCGRLDDLQRLDAVTFTRGASLELAFTAVRLSANGRDFSPSTTLFEYYAPPTVLSVEPPCGPLDGGTSVTIRGLGLQRPAESVSNGRSSGYKCGWGERFTYYSEPMISAISPSGGAIEGGTRVTLSGSWPVETDEEGDSRRLLRCRFGREVQFVGEGLAFTYYAPTPLSQPMRPTLGPHLGGTYIGLPHVPIIRGARYLCRIGGPEGQLVPAQIGRRAGLPSAQYSAYFGDAEDDNSIAAGQGAQYSAYFGDAEDDNSIAAGQGGGDAEDARSDDGVAVRPELMCAMPFVPVMADVGIEVSMNGQQFATVDANFSYHSPMVTAGLAPLSGPSDGETDVLVRLVHVSLSPRQLLATAPQMPPEYVCRFEDTWRAAALAEPPPLLRADEQLSPNRGELGTTISHENRSSHYALEALRALECTSGGAESDVAACAAPLGMLTLRCSTPPMRAVRTSGVGPVVTVPIVSASVNAQDFAEARSAAFHYYPPPHVSSVHPTLGPRAGRTMLTVRGSGLYGRGEHHLCRFVMRDDEPSNPLRGVPRNATERSLVALSQQPPPLMDSEPFYPLAGADALYEPLPLLTPASYDAPSRTLRCVTPAIWPAENAAQTDAPSIRLRLEVSANGQQYTSDGVEFLMHASAVLSQFTPSGGPAAGGTAIRINGFGLANGSEYVCRAGAARVLMGGRMDYGTGQLHCTMPSHAACELAGTEIGMSAVAVSTNGQQFSADFFFEFAAPAAVSRITPAAGPQLGGILVQVQGANLRAGHAISGSALPALSCRFGETSVPATFENASASVLCTSPARPPGALAFELTSNGQDYTRSSMVWVQYVAPSLSALQPPAGPQRGGTRLTIAGTHLRVSELATDARYVCGFGSGPPMYVWPEPAVGMVPSEGALPPNGTNATETVATGNVTMPPTNRTAAANATETSAPPGSPSPLAPPSIPPGLPPFPSPPPDRSLATVIILPAAMSIATYDPSTGLLRCRSPSIDLAVLAAQYGANVSSGGDAQYDANATNPRSLPLQVPVRVALHDPPDQHWSPLEGALQFGYYEDGALNVMSPRTGPVAGGTRLVITGGPFARYLSSSSPSGGSSGGSSMPIGAEASLEEGDTELQRCILGDPSSVHSLAFPRIDSGSHLVCTTTALARSANGAEPLLSFTGESLLSFTGGQEDVGALLGGSVTLLGGGRLWNGLLELPEVRPGGLVYGGAIVTHGLQAPHAAAFDVTFEVALHRPTSPEGTAVSGGSVAGGVSFNFGPIPDDAILDDGGYEQGFVLTLLPADGLRVRSNGIEVGFDPSARSNGWTLMRVRSNGTHVSVAQDGTWVPNLIDVAVALQPATTPDGFATHERWRFAFGGRPSGDVAHQVTHFHVRSVSLLSSLTLPVLHAANGQQFGPSSLNFTWLLPPVTSHVYPSSGARYGATTVHVYGANLAGGDDYRCRFDAPMLRSRPLIMPAIEVPSTTSSGTSVRCVTPELLSTGWVLLTLTLNGQQYSHTAVNFTVLGNGAVGASAAPSPAWANLSLSSYSWGAAHLETLQLWPVLGPTDGQTTIQVFGAGFDGGTEFRCRFLSHSGEVLGTVNATLESPSAVVAAYHRHVLASNQTVGRPVQPNAAEGSLVTTSPTGGVVESGGWLDAGQAHLLTCTTPAHNQSDFDNADPTAATRVAISVNGQQYYSSESMRFRYHTPSLLRVSSPQTGPTDGGTLLTIAFANGTLPRAGGPVLCRLDGVAVDGTIAGAANELIRCTTPAELPLVLNETYPQRLALSGSAHLEQPGWAGRHSLLHLTRTTSSYGQESDSGSAFLHAQMLWTAPHTVDQPPPRIPPWLRATLRLRLRGTASESSFSFSYGQLPGGDGAGRGLGFFGIGSGLRVNMITRRSAAVRRPTIVSQLLYVVYDGTTLYGPINITSPLNGDVGRIFEVSLNGQQIADHALSFVRYHGAHISTVFPTSGPVAGNSEITLMGANLAGGDNYTCRFGTEVSLAALRPDGSVTCYSPPNCAGSMLAQVALNAQQYAPGVQYTYTGGTACTGTGGLATGGAASDKEGTRMYSLSPNSGPQLGQTRIVVSGQAFSFGSEYVCQVNRSATFQPASYISDSELACFTPSSNLGAVSVRVSLNAQQFVGNASVDFVFHEQPSVASISPRSGASVGGTLVNVSGSGFADGSQYTCAFGSSVVGATFVPSLGVISCYAPAGLYGSAVALKVSLNAQQYSSEVHTFGYHGVTTVGTYSPSSGPSAGGTRVVVRGAELYGGSDYRCRFGACGACEAAWSCGACVVNATYVAESALGLGDDAIECVSPSGSAAGVALEVSLNSQQYTRTNLSTLAFTYYEAAVVSSVSPSLGPRDGATLVTILGSGLNSVATNLKCRFAVSAGATSFSSTADAT
ncbi:hypothetical protein Ctob_002698 [Chrysochromulina tobinii]|uniref:IPT/TIG domain-containing protein n=1 Tax=Chrysochromulina tobinii TaxID=1460289 RepID=A0A0M0J6W7_9EUKA|nr:hypothetical protein Ctob_002698 [Chrysochromulina tobinii]|eukprot:KOO22077.1 hypothetical protein Ctob_002698 [Chrysochromulina sp. CCMP291]